MVRMILSGGRSVSAPALGGFRRRDGIAGDTKILPVIGPAESCLGDQWEAPYTLMRWSMKNAVVSMGREWYYNELGGDRWSQGQGPLSAAKALGMFVISLININI